MKTGPQIGIVEDDPLYAEFLELLVAGSGRYTVAAVCGSAEAALALPPEVRLAACFLDLGLPGRSGLAVLPELRRAHPGILVVMLTAERADAHVLEALRAGACGYVLKGGLPTAPLQALDDAFAGGVPVSPAAARSLVDHLRQEPRAGETSEADGLTPRERQILALVAEGMPDKWIADRLGISASTVKNHLTHIYEKWRVHSRTEAALRFARTLRPGRA